MTLDRERALLCFVFDCRSADTDPVLWELGDDVWRSIDLLQIRGKGVVSGALEANTVRWVERLKDLPTAVIVNDRVDIALAAAADGAHLGMEDLPIEAARESTPAAFLIGVSAHHREDLLAAQRAGADYAGLGAFFSSTTKAGARVLDLRRAELLEAVPGLAIPVLAIGGVAAGRVGEVFQAPAVTGVAASAAIQSASDPAGAVHELRAALDRAWSARLQTVGW
ncbi:MAG TPA: thiamine phosphate synthase [Gemmatimonadota bacterium]|nr:thiamine phosphate synthase [Gemmatimonadota bacterium]